MTTFYAQPADPTAPVPSGTILVVAADGKGVPLAQRVAWVRAYLEPPVPERAEGQALE